VDSPSILEGAFNLTQTESTETELNKLNLNQFDMNMESISIQMERFLEVEKQLRAYRLTLVTPLPMEAAMLVFKGLWIAKGDMDGRLTEEEIGLVMTHVMRTAEWRRHLDEARKIKSAEIDGMRVFAQGLTDITEVVTDARDDAIGYKSKITLQGKLLAEGVGVSKKASLKEGKLELIEKCVGIYHTLLPILEVKDSTIIKQIEAYGMCDRCGCNVRLEGHEERCKPMIPSVTDPVWNISSKGDYDLGRYLGDRFHSILVVLNVTKRGAIQLTQASIPYLDKQHQAPFFLEYCKIGENGYSAHTLADCFEYMFVSDKQFCEAYCRKVGFDFSPEMFQVMNRSLTAARNI
jgi:hypothetical protein